MWALEEAVHLGSVIDAIFGGLKRLDRNRVSDHLIGSRARIVNGLGRRSALTLINCSHWGTGGWHHRT